MRIAIDLRPLLCEIECGVCVYTKAMVRALLENGDFDIELFYQAKNRSKSIQNIFPSARHIQMSNSIFHLKSLFRFPILPDFYFKKTPDLIWIPDRRPFYRTSIPVVMTIHDLVPEKLRNTLSLKSVIWHKIFNLKRLLDLCNGVIAPSDTVRSMLPRSIPSEVTFEGATFSCDSMMPPQMRKIKDRAFFLVISPNDPRKGLDKLPALCSKFPKVFFVVAGAEKNDKRFKPRKFKSVKNLVMIGVISESEKLWLLKNTNALLSLSIYEGFDLPVLEAVRAGCPVIMSDISVHRELYKSSENIFSDMTSLVAKVYRALNSKLAVPIPRAEMTWERSAEKASLFFRRVIVNKNGK